MVRVKRYFGFIVLSLVTFISLSLTGCTGTEAPETPGGAMSASECINDPVYDTELRVFGEVSSLGDLDCTCFLLSSDGADILVWYDSMIEDDGTERPPVSIEGIRNGDQVIVTGELKTAGEHKVQGDFWLSNVEQYQ
jgi:hypothetical protein